MFCPRSAAGAGQEHLVSHPGVGDPHPWLLGSSASVTQGSQGHCGRLCPKSRRQELMKGGGLLTVWARARERQTLLLSAVADFLKG